MTRTTPGDDPDLTALADAYYRHVERTGRPVLGGDDGIELVRRHREVAAVRRPGETVARVVASDGSSAVLAVTTDDMPYLVDSVVARVQRAGVTVRRVVHPVLVVRRDSGGELLTVHSGEQPGHQHPSGAVSESWMAFELDTHDATGPTGTALEENELVGWVQDVVADVRQVVEDSPAMFAAQVELADRLEATANVSAEGGPDPESPGSTSPRWTPEQLAETAALLRWLAGGHFTLLGYRRYEASPRPDGGLDLSADVDAGLGVLRGADTADAPETAKTVVTGVPRAPVEDPGLLVLTQASSPAAVLRAGYPFFVGVSDVGADGTVVAEHRFLGVFPVSAMHEDVLDIPVLRLRTLEVIAAAGYELDSFSGQAMLEVVQTYPRTELFATDRDTLARIVTAVLALDSRSGVRLFLRRDTYGRFVSCLVYLARDRYTTHVRLAIAQVLLRELGGSSLAHTVRVGESNLAVLHFTVQTPGGSDPDAVAQPAQERIEAMLEEVSRGWDDTLLELAAADPGTTVSPGVLAAWADALPEGYKEDFDARTALADIARLARLADDEIDLRLYARPGAAPGEARLSMCLGGRGISLSRVLPVLASMDVEVIDERPYEVARPDGLRCWIYDFGLAVDPAVLGSGEQPAVASHFTDTFTAVWRGEADADRFNALVLKAGLAWREAAVLRAYAGYLRQGGLPYSPSYVQSVLLANPLAARALVRLFDGRLDPGVALGPERAQPLVHDVSRLIDEVSSLDADRILRAYLALVQATVRTNYWMRDGAGRCRPYLSLKLTPRSIAELPAPRPRHEIYVHSPRVEGVHLRFGAVARGGLRWSDRPEDYRTEVLGLVKAQEVKNAVIVPVGAKGGFVVKRPPTTTGDPARDREATAAEGLTCYRWFISGLLDLTDNLDPVSRQVLPPRDVVRHDGDDTYLVVAADKGTASFSDTANEVAASYDYWLGDAFASGGSVGYDHKEMGITAKGAWESVRRHFHERGLDTRADDFTVVGVGDMSGDVFGNGMLLSEHIRLVAAFDHRHVFLDPDPDRRASFAERERMFTLTRSSWADYDTATISEGGGVWPRTAKSVPIAPAVRRTLGLGDDVTRLSPPELVRAILLAPVDLLWNGGIGTYVKAAGETHAEVGDKANDAVRVNGRDLRAAVVGEGGNLGLTQRGRIEFDRAGGRVNTDAWDNSAGVDCSDHEVNIKIVLDGLVTRGTLARADRDALLAEMTDDVSALVLADNVDQNELLGISRANSPQLAGVDGRLVSALERNSGLDRTLEVLPSKSGFAQLAERGQGLSSPETATLAAQVKLALKHELLAGDLPDLEVFSGRLPRYFPAVLRERYPDAIAAHPLRREIITTMVVNEIVYSGGVSYVFRAVEETGAAVTEVVRAHAAATEVFDIAGVQAAIRAAAGSAPAASTDALSLEVCRLLDRVTRWLLANRPQPLAVGAEIARYGRLVAELSARMPGWLRGEEATSVSDQAEGHAATGVPLELGRRVAGLLHAFVLLDVVDIADLVEREADEVAQLYFALSEHLRIDRLLTAVSGLERGDRWHSLARLALRDDLYGSLRALTVDVLRGSEPDESSDEKIEQWEQGNRARLARARTTLGELAERGSYDLATLSVAARQVRSMVRGAGSRPGLVS